MRTCGYGIGLLALLAAKMTSTFLAGRLSLTQCKPASGLLTIIDLP